MSLFSKTPEPEKTLERPEEIRKMGGHDGSMANAIADAPDDTGIAIPSEPARKSRTRIPKPTGTIPAPQGPTISPEDIIRQKQIAEAQKKIGESMMLDIAGVPYDIWAFVASDESLSLTKAEEKELADAYYLVAQSMSFSSMSPFWQGMLFLISRNARLVKARVKLFKELDKTIKEIKDSRL
jgi:hypothetical protein